MIDNSFILLLVPSNFHASSFPRSALNDYLLNPKHHSMLPANPYTLSQHSKSVHAGYSIALHIYQYS